MFYTIQLCYEMVKKELIILICLLSSFSCASQKKEVIAKSTIKLEGGNTNIRDLIEIDGYYADSIYRKYGSYIFFEDGTWVYFHFKGESTNNEIKSNLSKTIVTWKEGKQILWGGNWGVYAIRDDTIIIHSYDKPALLKGWSLDEIRFKIIDREAIKAVYFRSILKSADDYYKTHSPWKNGELKHFTSADSLPSSDNWLKEHKWIWRNESDWKNYMQKIKKK
ncbi:hypothetical protein CLV62_12159 [Dysgonomonas alginatilytica]|uniref:Uncharacterized protein n=1 Tax=Dysgonomonas alginatilytica TaxID=1605892 RepID=A0A2V3PMU2_9BACT|nr:hypothetical protein [Dysgonomonas alginatilytica]PXV62236.1 hypothetical protein CLV62_12159 [Dysgonomonas alginatilytica]